MSEQVDLSTIPISPEGGNNPSASDAAPANDGKVVTVFDDSSNFNVKHPLANDWTLWFTKPASGKVGAVHSQSHYVEINIYHAFANTRVP